MDGHLGWSTWEGGRMEILNRETFVGNGKLNFLTAVMDS